MDHIKEKIAWVSEKKKPGYATYFLSSTFVIRNEFNWTCEIAAIIPDSLSGILWTIYVSCPTFVIEVQWSRHVSRPLSSPHSQGVPCSFRGTCFVLSNISIANNPLDKEVIMTPNNHHKLTNNGSERHHAKLPSPPFIPDTPLLLSLCPRRLDHPVSALCPVSVCVFGRKIDQSRHFLWEILLL